MSRSKRTGRASDAAQHLLYVEGTFKAATHDLLLALIAAEVSPHNGVQYIMSLVHRQVEHLAAVPRAVARVADEKPAKQSQQAPATSNKH